MRFAVRRGVAVGFFDGVHLGHQAILGRADSALTFRNHPLTVLAPERAPRLLMDADARLAAIRACGVESVVALDFTRDMADMSPEDFVAAYLAHAKDAGVLCGENWRFGRRGEGDADFLRGLGIAVEVVPYAVHGGERISSTRIRAAVETGELGEAAAMLGRPWSASGEVFKGKGVGAKLGFPTVNIRLDGLQMRLRRGVYEVAVAGVHGVANYGTAPTMGERAWRSPVLEVHFPKGPPPDAAAGGAVTVDFLKFIRPERKFSSAENLVRQIAADCGIICA